jgi:hypothetical protein
LLAIGGWLGISYDNEETNRVASILYGAGGGLIVDEVGLLLAFNNYWTALTYTFFVVFLAFVLVLMLFYRYRLVVIEEFSEFVSSKASLYLGVFLVVVSVAFITPTDNFLVTAISSLFVIVAVILILTFLVRQLKIVSKKARLRLGD